MRNMNLLPGPAAAAGQFMKNADALLSVTPFGNGHIGDTYLVKTTGETFILQRLNTAIFKDPDALMENIRLVTGHLKEKILQRNGDPEKETLTILPAPSGELLYKAEDGTYRAYLFIKDGVSFEQIDEDLFYETGVMFSRFQKDLSDFDASLLTPVIPDFHNTEKRYRDFIISVSENTAGRAKDAEKEIRYLKSQEALSHVFSDPSLPLRVTHNDTKLNNVLLNPDTKKGLAVIDLDTVMPGLILMDFGDAIRTGANTAEENERDLSKVSLSLPLYRAFLRGFLSELKETITGEELEKLPLGAMAITYEQALRFLTDYLNGDTYYKISSPDENLVRTRCQIALLQDMLAKRKEMEDAVRISD